MFAPPGHTGVQAMLSTDYDWWATRGSRYQNEKDDTARRILACINHHLPGVQADVLVTGCRDAAPVLARCAILARSVRGWLPGTNAFKHVSRQLPGLDRFCMAGQWVDPGGGVPASIMSGRHVAEIICAEMDLGFAPPLEPAAQSA